MDTKEIDRREFMTEFGIKLAGAGLLLNQFAGKPAFGAKEPPSTAKKEPTMEYRTLGKTGLKVSAVSLGLIRLKEPAVVFKALDLGVNYFDTANNYLNGNSEKMLGEVLKEYGRKKVFIATKILPSDFNEDLSEAGKYRIRKRKTMDEMTDTSLKRLQTDYVDVLLVHGITHESWMSHEEILAFATNAKKSGKARFVGVSLHDPRCYVDVADQVSKSPIYDVLVAWLNFQSPPEWGEALKKTRKADKGIIAMKTQTGGYESGATATLSPHQAALKWVLDKDFVDCAITGMMNIEHVVENVGVVGKKMGWNDRKVLHAYYDSIKHYYCIMCGKCSSTCTNRVEINTINRALMY